MKLLKEIQLLVVLSVLCCACFGAEEPCEPAKQKLKFRVSDKPWMSQFPGSGKSTHIAFVHLKNVRNWQSPYLRIGSSDRRIGDWRGVVQHVVFQDKGSMTGSREFVILSNFALRRQKNGANRKFTIGGLPSEEMWLYADSAEQARVLAKAFIERVSGLADAHMRRPKARQKSRRAEVASLESGIPQLENELKQLKQKLTGYEKTIYYRNARDAKSSILQWNTLLNQVDVDIIGIRAKLDSIKEFEKIERERFARDSLHSMQMAEEVELAGALARKNAAQSHREEALAFLDLTEKANKLGLRLMNKSEKLSDTRGNIAKVEKWLSQEKPKIKPVEVVNNEVTIYPLPSPKD